MATIVFWTPNLAGHLHSTLQMATRLRQHGHRVLYAGPEEAGARVISQGFDFVPVAFARPFPGGGKLRRSGLTAKSPIAQLRDWLAAVRRLRRETEDLLRTLSGAAEKAESFVSRWRPDLQVFDPFLLMYSIPFHGCGVPSVALSTKPLLDPDPLVPPYTSGIVPRDSQTSRLEVQLAWLWCHVRYRIYKLGILGRKLLTGYSPFDLALHMAKQVGFPLRREWAMRPVPLDFRLRSTPEIVLMPQELDFPRLRTLRANVRYAGPCPSIGRREPAFPWDQVRRSGHLVLCSLGAVDPLQNPAIPGFLRRIAEACGKLDDATLILSLGGNEPAVFAGLPPNVYAFRSVPQIEVLRHADLFICHGGANSIKESLIFGVPLLIYPMRNDQAGNAARVLYHGLGLRGNYRRDSAESIGQKARILLNDRAWRTRAREMQRVFERYEKEATEVAILESFLPSSAARDPGHGR